MMAMREHTPAPGMGESPIRGCPPRQACCLFDTAWRVPVAAALVPTGTWLDLRGETHHFAPCDASTRVPV